MGKQVDLIYNPFTQAATLRIDSVRYERNGSKLAQFLEGKPMSDWLEAQTDSYQHWEGFLVELITELNEDDIDLVFYGVATDYHIFADSILRQGDFLEDIGFSARRLTLAHTERYAVKQVVEDMRKLRSTWNLAIPTQRLLLQRDELDALLETATDMDDLYKLVDGYTGLISALMCTLNEDAQRKAAQKARSEWKKLIEMR